MQMAHYKLTVIIIAEDLILPSAVNMCETVLGTEYAAKQNGFPLSDNTIWKREEDMKAQLIDMLKEG